MSNYTPTGLPFESQELPCTLHQLVREPLCIVCQYAQTQRHLESEQAQRARDIIDRAIQDHSIGQYATFGERSLEQDVWNEIQAQAEFLESGSWGMGLDDLTLSSPVNRSDLITSGPIEQETFGTQTSGTAENGGDKLMHGGSNSSTEPFIDPDQLDVSFGDYTEPGVNKTEVRSGQNVTIDEDNGMAPNRCQRCCRLKKGCDRRRPCQRCEHAGLGADDCIPQLGSQSDARLLKEEQNAAERQRPF